MLVYVASYPRSGNHFTQNLLTHYFYLHTSSMYPVNEDPRRNISQNADGTFTDPIINIGFREPHLPPQKLAYGLSKVFTEQLRQQLAASEELYLVKTHEVPYSTYFPGEKVIHIIRHPGAVIWSYYNYHKQITEINTPMIRLIRGTEWPGSWSDHTDAWQKLRASNPESVLQLQYERLIQDAEGEMKRVGHFLQVAMQTPQHEFPTFEEWHNRVPKHYRSGKYDEWKQYLTAAQLRALKNHHWRTMYKFGYEITEELVALRQLQESLSAEPEGNTLLVTLAEQVGKLEQRIKQLEDVIK